MSEPNPEVAAAIELVARHAIAESIVGGYGVTWENYPEIGRHDWERVELRMTAPAPFPPEDEYAAAYALLTSRAENDGG